MAKKPKVYTFRVTIKQEDWSADAGNNFGPRDGWAEEVYRILKRGLLTANLVQVK